MPEPLTMSKEQERADRNMADSYPCNDQRARAWAEIDALRARIAELERERDEARYHLREVARVGDTLSPQELINHAAAGCGVDRHEYSGECDPNRSMVELRSEVERLRSETAWVQCSDRMPERHGIYLCTVTSVSGALWLALCEWVGTSWSSRVSGRPLAWRPLPAPYNPEANDA